MFLNMQYVISDFVNNIECVVSNGYRYLTNLNWVMTGFFHIWSDTVKFLISIQLVIKQAKLHVLFECKLLVLYTRTAPCLKKTVACLIFEMI